MSWNFRRGEKKRRDLTATTTLIPANDPFVYYEKHFLLIEALKKLNSTIIVCFILFFLFSFARKGTFQYLNSSICFVTCYFVNGFILFFEYCWYKTKSKQCQKYHRLNEKKTHLKLQKGQCLVCYDIFHWF